MVNDKFDIEFKNRLCGPLVKYLKECHAMKLRVGMILFYLKIGGDFSNIERPQSTLYLKHYGMIP